MRPVERTEVVPLERAVGRVAARSVRAPRPVPEFRRATWDGYALRSRDVRYASPAKPVRLRVVGEVFAEQTFAGRLRSGEAVAVATGGAVPEGADALEIVEEVHRVGRAILVQARVRRGARIAPRGDDFAKGTLLVRSGEQLRPPALGALAAAGIGRVAIYARPRVAIVPNGNELRPPGGRLRPGEIFESNNAALTAFVAAWGGEPHPQRSVRDEPVAIVAALRAALKTSDLVLATGGSSVGEHDHLPRLFPRLGRPLFRGVAVRPGKPTLAARSGTKLLIGLPGHPTSCLLNMHWLVLPVLRRLARLPGSGWSVRGARWGGPPARRTPGMSTVVPLRIEGDRVVSTFRGSSSITSLRGAEAFAILPPGRASVRRGSRLDVCVLDRSGGVPASG